MTTNEDRDRLESTLDQTNPRLHLYTLAGHSQSRVRVAAPVAEQDFVAMMQEIESAKAGG